MNSIFKFSCLLVVFILACAIPIFYQKKIMKRLGNPILKFSTKKSKSIFIALFLLFAVLILAFFKNFKPMSKIVIFAAAIYGGFSCMREFLLQQLDGIYQNAIILNGKLQKKSDFCEFVSLDDEYLIENRTIIFKNRAGNNCQLVFCSFDDCKKAQSILKTWL